MLSGWYPANLDSDDDIGPNYKPSRLGHGQWHEKAPQTSLTSKEEELVEQHEMRISNSRSKILITRWSPNDILDLKKLKNASCEIERPS